MKISTLRRLSMVVLAIVSATEASTKAPAVNHQATLTSLEDTTISSPAETSLVEAAAPGWVSSILRPDHKKHPLFGTPFLRCEVYFYADLFLEIVFGAMTLAWLEGPAKKLYLFIVISHMVLLALCDYGLPKENKPFLNLAIIPLAFMNLFDCFIIGCDLLAPFVLEGFNGITRWLFPLLFGFPVLSFVGLYLDPNPTATKATTAM